MNAVRETQILPYADAVKFITAEKRARWFGLHLSTFVRWTLQNPAKDGRQGEAVGAVIRLTRKQTLDFLDSAVHAHHRSKVSLQVTYEDNWLFIGEGIWL